MTHGVNRNSVNGAIWLSLTCEYTGLIHNKVWFNQMEHETKKEEEGVILTFNGSLYCYTFTNNNTLNKKDILRNSSGLTYQDDLGVDLKKQCR